MSLQAQQSPRCLSQEATLSVPIIADDRDTKRVCCSKGMGNFEGRFRPDGLKLGGNWGKYWVGLYGEDNIEVVCEQYER